VIATQASGLDVNPHWGAAAGLILLGIVALVATVARARGEEHDAQVSSEEPAG